MAPTTTDTPSQRVTPLTQLFNLAIKGEGMPSLPDYLAASRAPGPNWLSYDQIAAYLADLTGRPVNRVTIKKITEVTYGIPDTRYWGGHNQPRAVTAEEFDLYTAALLGSSADVAWVTETVAAGLPDDSATETDAIVSDPDTMSAIADGEADLANGHTTN